MPSAPQPIRPQADPDHEAPAKASERNADPGHQGPARSIGCRGAEDERRVEAGSDDQEGCRGGEVLRQVPRASMAHKGSCNLLFWGVAATATDVNRRRSS